MVGEAHTTAENLIKPCILNIVSVMLNKAFAKGLARQ
jgi:hypothetical protein